MLNRTIFTSRDVSTRMNILNQEVLNIFSFFPVDRSDCPCQPLIEEFKMKMAVWPQSKREDEMEKMGHFKCPASTVGKKYYEIYCNQCGAVQGYCYASDKSLEDWTDFHYAQWSDGVKWHGLLTPNISPIDGKLTLECTCGNDTRDFRANMTLPGKVAFEKEEANKKGRLFNRNDSKFSTRDITNIKRDTIISRISKK